MVHLIHKLETRSRYQTINDAVVMSWCFAAVSTLPRRLLCYTALPVFAHLSVDAVDHQQQAAVSRGLHSGGAETNQSVRSPE